MNLTINDVRRKQFDKVFRGYDPTEVDLFLKQLADRLEAVQDEARRADERVREMESKLSHYEKVELALQEALESARETARRSEATAEEKARLMIQEAELRAERILHDAQRERHGLRQDLVRLNARQAEVAARLRGFLLSELEVLAQFQGDDPVGFIKLQSAHPQGRLQAPAARLEAPTEEPDLADEDFDLGEPAAPPAAAVDAAPEVGAAPHQPPTAGSPDDDDEAPAPPDAALDGPVPAEAWADVPTGDESAGPGVPEWEAPEAPTAPAPHVSPAEAASAPPQPPSFGGRGPWDAVSDEIPGAYAAADDPAAPAEPPSPESFSGEPTASEPASGEAIDATPPAAVTGGWDLRSLVTGTDMSGESNVAGSEEERDRIRRILDDLE